MDDILSKWLKLCPAKNEAERTSSQVWCRAGTNINLEALASDILMDTHWLCINFKPGCDKKLIGIISKYWHVKTYTSVNNKNKPYEIGGEQN